MIKSIIYFSFYDDLHVNASFFYAYSSYVFFVFYRKAFNLLFYYESELFTSSRKRSETLNTGTYLSFNTTISLVAGLRACLAFLFFTLKLPNPRKSTRSERFIALEIDCSIPSITISVSVNSDYPVEETETIDNTTIDNETVDNVTYTDNLTWSDNFTYFVSPTQEQKIRWAEFIDNMTNDNWTSISIGNPDNMTTCDNATMISNVIEETKDNASYELLKQSCNDMYWNWAICWNTREIGAYSTPQNDCKCTNSGYTLRPAFHNRNWGGVGKACSSDYHSLKVILKK